MSSKRELWTGAEPLQAFFDAAPCGLISGSSDGTILAVNDTFLHWTGYAREQLIDTRHFDELLTAPCRLYYETHFWPLLHIQGFVHEVALDIRRSNGTSLPALVSSSAQRRSDGSVALLRHAIFVAEDRRAYERELLLQRRNSEEAVKAKADFLAMFAHEVRNPLCAVVLEAELLEREAIARNDSSITELRESLDRVLKLLNSMLDISRLDAGKISLQMAEFEIGDVVRAVVHSLHPLAQARQLPLTVRIDQTLRRRVIGDPVKLDQALTNLVGNAIKFTESGSVTIGAARIAPRGGTDLPDLVHVRFDVADTGIGIAPERTDRIFEEYEQADPSISRRFGGTGLGLAITRKLVELQGGHLAVVSELGFGSTFSFELEFEPA
jgi:PAS domain S-box-containing protein